MLIQIVVLLWVVNVWEIEECSNLWSISRGGGAESCRVSGEREKDRKRFVNTVNLKKKMWGI